jgi:hypothetical protein
MKRLDGIYRGYSIFEKDNVWKIELEGKTITTFNKILNVDGKASCMNEIDRIKREDYHERERNIQRVDAQVKATRDGARNLKKDKIIQYIDRLRVDARRLTSESVSKEVEKLDIVYKDACAKKQYSAAVNAIRLKSQLLGFLVEKKEVQHSTLDAMNDDDLTTYLDKIEKEHNIQ